MKRINERNYNLDSVVHYYAVNSIKKIDLDIFNSLKDRFIIDEIQTMGGGLFKNFI